MSCVLNCSHVTSFIAIKSNIMCVIVTKDDNY